jgi:hypothetical protein
MRAAYTPVVCGRCLFRGDTSNTPRECSGHRPAICSATLVFVASHSGER